jgi:hypothetical protein
MKGLFLGVGLTLQVGAAFAQSPLPKDAAVIDATSLTEDQLREAIVGKVSKRVRFRATYSL